MKGMTNILGGKLRRNKPCLTPDERSSHNKSKHCRADKSQRRCYGYARFFLWVSMLLYLCSAGPDLFWLVGWKPEKPEAVGDVIQKPMVRAGGLVTNVLAEENYTQGRGRKNVFSDSRAEFSGFVDVKVFVYELPSEFNEDWLVNSRCASHLFAAEVAIHRALLNSSVRVFDPQEADFFFVPVYVSCNFSTKNGFPALGHARPLLGSAVRYISETMPFWNRSGGSDHVFAATHDYGACFHAMEEVAIRDEIPEFLQNSIILQTFGVKGKHRCQDVEHIQIPRYVAPKPIEALWAAAPPKAKHDIWVFFRGKMEIPEFNGYSCGVEVNELYRNVQLYLSSLDLAAHSRRVTVARAKNSTCLSFTPAANHTMEDTFRGSKLWWTHRVETLGADLLEERRSLTLKIKKRDRAGVLSPYLRHLEKQVEDFDSRSRDRKLYTNNGHGYRDCRWTGVSFRHPPTFSTLALDLEMKENINADLDLLGQGKEIYHHVGPPWKSGYLLYCPPGTGKSSLIAAMANYLHYDVYDLVLTKVTNKSELRALLIQMANKSMIVIEDIDWSTHLSERALARHVPAATRNKSRSFDSCEIG